MYSFYARASYVSFSKKKKKKRLILKSDLSFLSLNDDGVNDFDSFCFGSRVNSRFVNFAPRKHALTRCCFTTYR